MGTRGPSRGGDAQSNDTSSGKRFAPFNRSVENGRVNSIVRDIRRFTLGSCNTAFGKSSILVL